MILIAKTLRGLTARALSSLVLFLLTAPVASAAGYGLLFDGTNDYVTFGAAPGLGVSTFTIETWFKRQGTGANASSGTGGVTAIPLVTKGRGEGDNSNVDMNYFLGIRASDNVLVADFEEGATGSTPGLNHPIAGVTPIVNNIWYHAAVTYNGTKWQLFLNGALQAELTVGQPPRADSIQHAALATAMTSTGVPAGFFNGILDEVRIWNHARTAQQISDNRALEIISAPGLIGRWGLNEGSGSAAADSSGSGIGGTLTNGPKWVAGFPLVPYGSVWKYRADGSNQVTSWRQPGFNDSSWLSGAAELGYGDGDEATAVGFIDTDPNASGVQKNATTYFRRTFAVTDPSQFAALILSMKYDDGGAVYVNGNEVARTSNLVSNPAFSTFCTGTANENATQTWGIPASVLVTGTNTIAVEIHQISDSSTDISFDLEIAGLATLSITRGPYLQIGTPTSVVLRWRTDGVTNSRVRFGTSQDNLNQAADDAAVTTEHEVTVSGLAPDTKYFYTVGSSTAVMAGGDASYFFETSPPPGTPKPTRIWVIGDAGTGTTGQTGVRNAYFTFNANPARHTDLWLMLGDNAYDTGTDAEFQTKVFDVYADLFKNSVVWPTLGNHDTAQATAYVDTYPYFAMFTLPKAAEAGGVASGTEHYYSFDYGNIHFVCLDSMTADRSVGGAMATWLASDLASTTKLWIIAFWHHPPYSKGSHDSDVDSELVEMREVFVPILEGGGVDLVLSGHSHVYERSKLIDGFKATPTLATSGTFKDSGSGREDGTGAYAKSLSGSIAHQGAVYSVVGSSGQITGGTPALNHPVMYRSLNNLGSLVIDINGNRLDAKFLRESGATPSVDDYFTIIKKPDVTVSATDLSAAETGPDPGAVTVTRTGNLQFNLTVSLGTSGSAVNGTDYLAPPTLVTLAAGQGSLTVPLVPIADSLAEGDENVSFTLTATANYALGNPFSATITIHDKPIDAWRFTTFGASANSAYAADDADPDGDGISNLVEYACGTSPLTPSVTGLPVGSISPQTVNGQTDNYLTMQFQRNVANTDLSYAVEVSNDLVHWSTLATSANGQVPSGPGFVGETNGPVRIVTVRDTVKVTDDARRFMRLRVQLSP